MKSNDHARIAVKIHDKLILVDMFDTASFDIGVKALEAYAKHYLLLDYNQHLNIKPLEEETS